MMTLYLNAYLYEEDIFMFLGPDTTPKSPSSLQSPKSPNEEPRSPMQEPLSPNEIENTSAYNELKSIIQNTWQRFGHLTSRLDKHKGLASTLAASAGVLWAAYEIYNNPAEMARFASHVQLPEMVVRSIILSCGLLMTGVPTVTTLYGGKAVMKQIKKGRKRTATQAELEENQPEQKSSENQLLVASNKPQLEDSPFKFDLNLTEEAMAISKPNPSFTPGHHGNKKRKLNNNGLEKAAEEALLVFKTPFIPPQ